MTQPNELTLKLKGATVSQVMKTDGELTFTFQGVQGGEFTFNGMRRALEGDITSAPYIVTDSKTATGLKRLHDDGEYVSGKGTYLHTVTPPEKFGYRLPEAYLWVAPDNLKSGTYANVRRQLGRSRNGINYERKNIRLRDRPKEAPQKRYEYALYEYWAACAAGEETPGWVLPTIEILSGHTADDAAYVIENNLYDMWKKKVLAGRFVINTGYTAHYQFLSCTEAPGDATRILVMDFSEPGSIKSLNKNNGDRNARPICLTFER